MQKIYLLNNKIKSIISRKKKNWKTSDVLRRNLRQKEQFNQRNCIGRECWIVGNAYISSERRMKLIKNEVKNTSKIVTGLYRNYNNVATFTIIVYTCHSFVTCYFVTDYNRAKF